VVLWCLMGRFPSFGDIGESLLFFFFLHDVDGFANV
jgi:hypothetical protein